MKKELAGLACAGFIALAQPLHTYATTTETYHVDMVVMAEEALAAYEEAVQNQLAVTNVYVATNGWSYTSVGKYAKSYKYSMKITTNSIIVSQKFDLPIQSIIIHHGSMYEFNKDPENNDIYEGERPSIIPIKNGTDCSALSKKLNYTNTKNLFREETNQWEHLTFKQFKIEFQKPIALSKPEPRWKILWVDVVCAEKRGLVIRLR